jgi:hypothetical protein
MARRPSISVCLPKTTTANVETKITEELGAKVVEIANKLVPRPFRFLVLAPPAGQLGTHPGGRFGHVPAQFGPLIQEERK